MTFSLAGRCERTGMLGIAVSSSSPAVAARCAHVRAGTGAVGSQNVTDPRLGPRLLDRLAAGDSPDEAIASLAGEPGLEWRQLTAVDSAGRSACRSGARTLGRHAQLAGQDFAAAGSELVEQQRPEPRVGDVLACGDADPRSHVGTAGGDGRARRGHDHPQPAAAFAPPEQ